MPSKITKSTSSDNERIRENQRRSRARKQAYLSELEQKYRNCEKTGAEASEAIQLAARRVLEENKRLVEENRRLRELLGGERDQVGDEGAEGRVLERLLGERRGCGGQDSMAGMSETSSLMSNGTGSEEVGRETEMHAKGDTSSCTALATLIRTARPNAGEELEQEMGCVESGKECSVPNTKAFDLLDRYSET